MTILQPTEQLRLLQSISPTPEQVLNAVGLGGQLPVDPQEVAKRLGVNCLAAATSELAKVLGTTTVIVEGFSYRRDEDQSFWVVYGSDWHENAQRFTVAHELAHVILHSDALPLNRNRKASRQALEGAANRFAAGLLMPESLLRLYKTLPASVVAKTFRVSPQAAEIRLSHVV